MGIVGFIYYYIYHHYCYFILPHYGGNVFTFKEACFLALKTYISFVAPVSKANGCLVGIRRLEVYTRTWLPSFSHLFHLFPGESKRNKMATSTWRLTKYIVVLLLCSCIVSIHFAFLLPYKRALMIFVGLFLSAYSLFSSSVPILFRVFRESPLLLLLVFFFAFPVGIWWFFSGVWGLDMLFSKIQLDPGDFSTQNEPFPMISGARGSH